MASNKEWNYLGGGDLRPQDPDKGLGHIVPVRTYNIVFVSLLILTILTFAIATVDLGAFNLPIALGIATFKASLVFMFFMHLNYESKIYWAIAICPLFIYLLMVLGTLGDEAFKDKTERLVPFSEEASKAKTPATDKAH